MILLVTLDPGPARQPESIRALCRESGDPCHQLQDVRDRIFVSRHHQRWAALQLDGAVDWLTDPGRRW